MIDNMCKLREDSDMSELIKPAEYAKDTVSYDRQFMQKSKKAY